MIFLTYMKIDETKARVMAMIYKHEELFEEQKAHGVYVESVPQPDSAETGTPVLYIKPETKEMWYEYLPVPEQPLYAETPVGRLEKQVDDLKLLLAEMIAGGTV